jgi:hypothetical protein
MLGRESIIRLSGRESLDCNCLDYQSILILVTEVETVDIQL